MIHYMWFNDHFCFSMKCVLQKTFKVFIIALSTNPFGMTTTTVAHTSYIFREILKIRLRNRIQKTCGFFYHWFCPTVCLGFSELCCAPPTCVVHHRLALCTMVHKGELCSWEVGVTPGIFSVALYWLDGAQDDFACSFELLLIKLGLYPGVWMRIVT